MNRVSICVVTHNNCNEILNLLKSIYENTVEVNFSVFVVDNNSSDNTVNLISKYYPNVEIIKTNCNKGFGYAHNLVIDKIDSDFHIIINPDISFNVNVLKQLSDYLSENNDVIIVTPKILHPNGSEQYLPKREPKIKYLMAGKLERFSNSLSKLRSKYTMENECLEEPVDIDFCTGCFMMIRTEIFKKLNGFDDRFFMYFEDADLSKRAKKFGRVIFFPKIYVTHSWERASSKKIKFLFIHISSMIKYLIKWNKLRGF
ncbi:MAG: N-acetylglucosaminyl-diphospho-decaprenol L-rhamnosyltransferase [Eubacteriales bacterium SKADARSKE-1]|nr:N-acetylglucosaminyl-diphospho-decaprenol L-rhamnosyltransferase [Eubacteriales bacterium SKADARSKE-1]